MALIAVLCLVITVSILTASAVALSQYSRREVNTFSNFTRTACIAEGTSNRALWLLLADKKSNPSRTLGSVDSIDAVVDKERFLADGVIHKLDYYGNNVKFAITDAITGIDISGSSPQREMTYFNLLFQDDAEKLYEFKNFCSRLQDYVDSDDLVRLESMESQNYQEQNLYNLPRNRRFRFREEILFVPGAEKYFKPDSEGRLSSIRIIPPGETRSIRGRLNLYSAPLALIAEQCELDEKEILQVKNALTLWKNNREPITDTLEPELRTKLKQKFSTSESGYYTITVYTGNTNSPGSTLTITLKPNTSTPQTQFHEWTL